MTVPPRRPTSLLLLTLALASTACTRLTPYYGQGLPLSTPLVASQVDHRLLLIGDAGDANRDGEPSLELLASQVRLLIPAPGLQLSPEQAAELFDLYRPIRREQPFQSDLPKAGSLDISLYVARGLVEGHGGKLDYSEELPGFVLTLPLLDD